jgi:hypothetical protein
MKFIETGNAPIITAMTHTINGRQLYSISITHFCGNLLWGLQTWHLSQCNALAYGNRMAAYHYANEPAGAIRVSAQLV